MRKIDDRIATMEQRLKTLKARQQARAAKQRREDDQRAKRNEERRKLLTGAAILQKVEQGEISKAQLLKWIDDTLTQPRDRALFDLE